MKKFKVGDKVKILSDKYRMLDDAKKTINDTFTIQSINHEDNEIWLQDSAQGYNETGILMFSEELAPANSEVIKKRLGIK